MAIVTSVAVVLADSVHSLHVHFDREFQFLEWGFTALFTVEYVARLACVRHPWRYATSFFGVVDLLSVLPTYVALLVPEAQALIDVRILRLLRIFRVLKLAAYVVEYQALGRALVASRRKIMVFLTAVHDDRGDHGDAHVRRGGARERLHQHSHVGLLGHHHDDDRRLRRHHAEDGRRAPHLLGHDAGGVGDARGADGHRHVGTDRAAPAARARPRGPAPNA